MTDILVLPVRLHGSDQSDRLHADLAAAHARGEDLGSRVPHMQAGGKRLLQMCREIEALIAELHQPMGELSASDQAIHDALQALLGVVQPLADATRRLPFDA
ncbi:hypothetical protein ACLBXO_31420 [Methylobacterium sp. C33D]